MEDSTAAALLVLHDLLILANLDAPQNLWEEMIRSRKLTWHPPVTSWQSGDKHVEIPWCKARWSSIREFDYLFDHLEQVIKWLMDLRTLGESVAGTNTWKKRKKPGKELECLFFALVDANWVTLEWDAPAGFRDGEPNWDEMTKHLIKLFGDVKNEQAGQVHKSQYTISGWVVELAVLLMPEILGTDAILRKAINEHFPEAWECKENKGLVDLYDFWVEQAPEIRYMRSQNLAKLHKGGLGKLAEELCASALPLCFSKYEKKDGSAQKFGGESEKFEDFTPKPDDVQEALEVLKAQEKNRK